MDTTRTFKVIFDARHRITAKFILRCYIVRKENLSRSSFTNIYLFGSAFISHSTNSFIFSLYSLTFFFLSTHFSLYTTHSL